MSEKNGTQRSLTRRGFLKTTAAMAGATAAAGAPASALTALAAEEVATEGEVQTYVCGCAGNCGGQCSVNVHVKDGRAFNITKLDLPDPDLEQVCQRGLTHLERIYDPNRIQYPMRRIGERGTLEFERISWDEAIAEIAEKWQAYQAEFGDNSVVFWESSGNMRNDVAGQGYVGRLAAYMGAGALNPGYDMNVTALADSFGYTACGYGGDWRDLVNADTMIVWGCNPTESAGVRCHWLSDALEAGVHCITIDPVFHGIAAKSHEYLSIRPGSDGLLCIGMMQTVLEEGLKDDTCLKTLTVAPFLVRKDTGAYLRASDVPGLGIAQQEEQSIAAGLVNAQAGGEAASTEVGNPIIVIGPDGKPSSSDECADPALEGTYVVEGIEVTTAYSLLLERLYEWDMATIVEYTDIPEERIRELARRFATGKTTIVTGYGIDHWVNGATFYLNAAALLMLTGNIAKPGCGVTGPSVGTLGSLGADISGIIFPDDAKGRSWLFGAKPFMDAVETGTYNMMPYTCKSLYIYANNPLGNMPDRNRLVATFDKIDFIVVVEVYMTETCKHADILLPAAHYFETETYYGGNSYMKITEKALEPAFESKGDLEICHELAHALGLGQHFDYDREEFNRRAFDNSVAQMFGLSWERLKAEKVIPAFLPMVLYIGATGFATTTGRAQFYYENPVPRFYDPTWDAKKESLPYWEAPNEGWFQNEKFETYPLVMVTERGKFKVHTMFSTVGTLLELDKEPYIKMSTEDAAARGVVTGDYVKVFNDRGYFVCRAAVNAGNRPGVLCMDHGWHEDQFIEGHYNNVANATAPARYATACWFDSLVQVEKC